MTFVCSCNILTLASHCKHNHALIMSFDDNGHVIRGLMRFELIKTIIHMDGAQITKGCGNQLKDV
jgi:hypothetical protein